MTFKQQLIKAAVEGLGTGIGLGMVVIVFVALVMLATGNCSF